MRSSSFLRSSFYFSYFSILFSKNSPFVVKLPHASTIPYSVIVLTLMILVLFWDTKWDLGTKWKTTKKLYKLSGLIFIMKKDLFECASVTKKLRNDCCNKEFPSKSSTLTSYRNMFLSNRRVFRWDFFEILMLLNFEFFLFRYS